jgi:hypothetical protein
MAEAVEERRVAQSGVHEVFEWVRSVKRRILAATRRDDRRVCAGSSLADVESPERGVGGDRGGDRDREEHRQ